MYFILVSKQKSYTLFTFKSRMQDQNGRHYRGLLRENRGVQERDASADGIMVVVQQGTRCEVHRCVIINY